jgi:hypothetical protein
MRYDLASEAPKPAAMTARSAHTIPWHSTLQPRFLRAPSVIVLILANLVPLAGVLLWGWDLLDLMILYWMETGIIGFYAIIQMAIAARWGALFYVPFFVIHFGGFMAGHLFFVLVMFSGQKPGPMMWDWLWDVLVRQLSVGGLWPAFAALCISHGVSFVINVRRHFQPKQLGRHAALMPDEPDPKAAMSAPYGRVIVMHLTIIFGAMLAQVLGSTVWAFVLLIVLKTAVDIAAHVRKNFSN